MSEKNKLQTALAGVNEIKIAYHVTPYENIPDILDKGILPMLGDLSQETNEQKARIYMFPSKEDLDNALSNWLGEFFDEDIDLAIIAVKVNDIHTYSEVEYELITDHAIPNSHIMAVLKEDYGYPVDYDYCANDTIQEYLAAALESRCENNEFAP